MVAGRCTEHAHHGLNPAVPNAPKLDPTQPAYIDHVSIPAHGPGPRWFGHVGQPALALVLAVFLLPPGLQSVRVGGISTAWVVGLAIALVVLHICVATARRWPSQSFVIGTLACATLAAGPDIDGVTDFVEASEYSPILLPSTLCFFALLYSVSAHTRPPLPNYALGLGLAGCCVTLARLWGFTGTPIATWAWWLFLGTTAFGGTIAAWALGRYRFTRALWATQKAERLAADERRHIAREMHDVVAHSVAVMVSHAEAGRLVVVNSPERAPEIFTTIADAGREALTEMRGLLAVLRDDAAATEPQPGLAELPALIDRMRAAGVDIEFSSDDQLHTTPAVALTIYRIIQEALTNIARHAGEKPSARVAVDSGPDGIEVHVTNTGVVQTDPRPGRGLIGMQERVDAVGGTLKAGPTATGWTVEVTVPR